MKRLFSLILVAALTFAVLYFVRNPDVLGNFWMWLVGLSGSVVAVFRKLIDSFKGEEAKALSSAKKELEADSGQTV